ncbi:MAG: flagellar export protein FliJ [Desulfitobacteriaceae bacterium]
MPKFRFRLEATLRLAELALEEGLRRLALEVKRMQELQQERDVRVDAWTKAVAGQRLAGINTPEDLGLWQRYAHTCVQFVRAKEKELLGQEEKVKKCREELAEAYREAEKFRRLKEKQLRLFRLAEDKREQKILDEAGQVLFWHQTN